MLAIPKERSIGYVNLARGCGHLFRWDGTIIKVVALRDGFGGLRLFVPAMTDVKSLRLTTLGARKRGEIRERVLY